MQARAAAWKQRTLQEEAEKINRAGGDYAGPDGSGQWVSVGELGWGGDLDAALGDVATGEVTCCTRRTRRSWAMQWAMQSRSLQLLSIK